MNLCIWALCLWTGWQAGAAPASTTATELVWAPTDAAVRKTWKSSHSLLAESLVLAVGDKLTPNNIPLRLKSTQDRVFVDEYELAMGAATDRPVSRVRRRFEDLNQVGTMGVEGSAEPPRRVVQNCNLEGLSVVFGWAPGSGAYGAAYDARESAESNLAGLRATTDMEDFLPSGPVNPGDTWAVPASALIGLVAPLGEVPWNQSQKGDLRIQRSLRTGLGGGIQHAFRGESIGEPSVKFLEVRHDDEGSFAVLQLFVEIRSSGDLTENVVEHRTPFEKAVGLVIRSAFIVLELQGEGELHWDLERNRPRSVSFTGRERVSIRIVTFAPGEADGLDRAQEMTMSGRYSTEASFESAEIVSAPGPIQPSKLQED